jgi:hypothetical protein
MAMNLRPPIWFRMVLAIMLGSGVQLVQLV